MKGSLYVAGNPKFSTCLYKSNNNHPSIACQSHVSPSNVKMPLVAKMRGLSFKRQKGGDGFVVGCASWGLVTELERELEDEMKPQQDEEKVKSGMATFRHKCGEREGVVELLECLEGEAIMGEDVGKEPMDYNRRAQIFDRSSQVFQALKELNNDVLPQQSS